MHIIELCKEPQASNSYIGGGVFIDTAENFPKDPSSGEFLTHFMSLSHDFFPTAVLPTGYQISIFLPANYTNNTLPKAHLDQFKVEILWKFTIQEEQESNAACVLLHKTGSTEIIPNPTALLPKYYLRTRPPSTTELEEELKDDDIAWMRTKLYGRPGFLQDEVPRLSHMHFLLQIFEADLVAIDKFYNGIFYDGAGYLFINNHIKEQSNNTSAGLFFAQYT